MTHLTLTHLHVRTVGCNAYPQPFSSHALSRPRERQTCSYPMPSDFNISSLFRNNLRDGRELALHCSTLLPSLNSGMVNIRQVPVILKSSSSTRAKEIRGLLPCVGLIPSQVGTFLHSDQFKVEYIRSTRRCRA